MGKPGLPFFARPPFIAPALDEIAKRLRAESQLRGLDVNAFSIRAGYLLGEINAVHPFREGNGRAQREFMRELTAVAGYQIDWSNTPSDLIIKPRRSASEVATRLDWQPFYVTPFASTKP